MVFALVWLAGCGGGGGSSGGGNGSAGRNAYVAVPQANAISAFRVAPSREISRPSWARLSVEGVPDCDRDSSLRQSVYAANQGENNIPVFTVDNNTGELVEVMPRTAAGLH